MSNRLQEAQARAQQAAEQAETLRKQLEEAQQAAEQAQKEFEEAKQAAQIREEEIRNEINAATEEVSYKFNNFKEILRSIPPQLILNFIANLQDFTAQDVNILLNTNTERKLKLEASNFTDQIVYELNDKLDDLNFVYSKNENGVFILTKKDSSSRQETNENPESEVVIKTETSNDANNSETNLNIEAQTIDFNNKENYINIEVKPENLPTGYTLVTRNVNGKTLYTIIGPKLDLSGANLQGANLQGANLQGANLQGANLQGANLQDAYLQNANLESANLYPANLQDAYLQNANLQDADLEEANLTRANLQGANLQGAILQDAYLTRANLQGANLQGVNLESAKLRGADLTGSNLEDANLADADLRGADLTGANLAGANLRYPYLKGAILHDVNLAGADLTGSNLEEAEFNILRKEAPEEIQAQVEQEEEQTQLPLQLESNTENITKPNQTSQDVENSDSQERNLTLQDFNELEKNENGVTILDTALSESEIGNIEDELGIEHTLIGFELNSEYLYKIIKVSDLTIAIAPTISNKIPFDILSVLIKNKHRNITTQDIFNALSDKISYKSIVSSYLNQQVETKLNYLAKIIKEKTEGSRTNLINIEFSDDLYHLLLNQTINNIERNENESINVKLNQEPNELIESKLNEEIELKYEIDGIEYTQTIKEEVLTKILFRSRFARNARKILRAFFHNINNPLTSSEIAIQAGLKKSQYGHPNTYIKSTYGVYLNETYAEFFVIPKTKGQSKRICLTLKEEFYRKLISESTTTENLIIESENETETISNEHSADERPQTIEDLSLQIVKEEKKDNNQVLLQKSENFLNSLLIESQTSADQISEELNDNTQTTVAEATDQISEELNEDIQTTVAEATDQISEELNDNIQATVAEATDQISEELNEDIQAKVEASTEEIKQNTNQENQEIQTPFKIKYDGPGYKSFTESLRRIVKEKK